MQHRLLRSKFVLGKRSHKYRRRKKDLEWIILHCFLSDSLEWFYLKLRIVDLMVAITYLLTFALISRQ